MVNKLAEALCPSCKKPLFIEKSKADKFHKNIQRTIVRCSKCGKSIKEAMQEKLKNNIN